MAGAGAVILFRAAWFISGIVALALGLVGIVLPLLPTTPFLLLAAVCFAQFSPALHDWIIHHPRLGPPISDWRAHRAISCTAKTGAMVLLAVALVTGILADVGPRVLAVQGAVPLAVDASLLTRPSPPDDR
jgi:uncharacterized protein